MPPASPLFLPPAPVHQQRPRADASSPTTAPRQPCTCRKGRRKRADPAQNARAGRGRAARRTVLYDAMAAYAAHFRALLDAELRAEQDAHLARMGPAAGRRRRRVARGDALYGLVATKRDRLFASAVFALAPRDGAPLPPPLRFAKADLVDVAPDGVDDAHAPAPVQGVVLAKHAREVLVAFPVGSDGAALMLDYARCRTPLGAERGANTQAYERAVDALDAFARKGPDATDMARLFVMSFADGRAGQGHGAGDAGGGNDEDEDDDAGGDRFYDEPTVDKEKRVAASASEPAKWDSFARESVAPPPQAELNAAMKALPPYLNDSQRAAIRRALRARLTLLQGPPGTGKTETTGHLIAAALRLRQGPVLACAASNVAVDNLTRSVLRAAGRTFRIVRVGRVAAVDDDLWELSVDGLLERDAGVRRARDAVAAGTLRASTLHAVERTVTASVLAGAHVVLGTCVGLGMPELDALSFGLAVVDEATQATEPDVLVALSRAGAIASRVVLVGDHHQLPPTVLGRRAGARGLETSLFLRLWRAGVACEMLDTQYRMHPNVSRFPSQHFYFGRLRDGVSAADRAFRWLPSGERAPAPEQLRVVFYNVTDSPEESDSATSDAASSGKSFVNKGEAELVIRLTAALLSGNADAAHADARLSPVSADEVGLISPYAGQVRYIRDLANAGKTLCDVEVATVDGFQGREKDVIILSTVRNNKRDQIGFLRDWRRLNVAITRARLLLVVVGNARTLRNDPHWAAWMRWVRKHGLVREATAASDARLQDA